MGQMWKKVAIAYYSCWHIDATAGLERKKDKIRSQKI
jgi:hypothetical protein